MATTKVKSRDELVGLREAWRAQGKKVGFTSGVFDIVHPGHVQYLEDAKTRCDLLIVGINSDSSVKKYKDPFRPIVDDASRAFVIAGLEAVDFCFIFDEVNNNENVTLLRPDLYMKAGDYSEDNLTSKPLVESYGGSVAMIPVKPGFSSSAVIKKIASQYGEQHGAPFPRIYERRPALFVDRDGTIIEHVEYLHEPEKVSFIPGALDALKHASELGYRIIVVTNQPGIGLGYFSKEDLFKVNKEILREASGRGLLIDKIYFCPHSKSDGCRCRKPEIGLVLRACEELNLDLKNSFVIGDMTSDIQLAKGAGCKSVLVKTGSAGKDKLFEAKPDYELSSLADLSSILPPAPHEAMPAQVKPSVIHESELQTVGYVTGKLGHDFNNLLGTLLGGVDLIGSRARKAFPTDNPFEKPLALMQSAITKAVDLTARMRSYARPHPIELSEFSLAETIKEAVQQFEKVHGPALAITVRPFEDVRVEINQFMVSRAFISLLENSLQAQQKGGSAEVVISVDLAKKGAAIVSLRDFGPGLSEKSGDPFKPFQTVKGGVGVGYGLSLAMARLNISKMRGSLSVRNARAEHAEGPGADRGGVEATVELRRSPATPS